MRFGALVGRLRQFFTSQQTPAGIALTPDIDEGLGAVQPPDSSWIGLQDACMSGWFQSETNEVFKGLPISAEDVVLDVGCGDGGIARFCATRGAAIILSDADAAKVASAEQSLAGAGARSIQAFVSDSNPLPLPNGVASVVISTEVLEHVADPALVLSELVRVGRPGARYLLTVPDPVAESLQKQLAPPAYFQKPNHVRIIQREEFADLVTSAGLVVESQSYYGFYWALWWIMFWTGKADPAKEHNPVLENWTKTWAELLRTPYGVKLQQALNEFMPKSQVIIARKP